MSISKVGQRRQIVIPKDVCEAVGIQEGDFVEVKRANGSVVIRPKKLVDAEDVLSRTDERKVARGVKQLKRGQSITWKRLRRDLGV